MMAQVEDPVVCIRGPGISPLTHHLKSLREEPRDDHDLKLVLKEGHVVPFHRVLLYHLMEESYQPLLKDMEPEEMGTICVPDHSVPEALALRDLIYAGQTFFSPSSSDILHQLLALQKVLHLKSWSLAKQMKNGTFVNLGEEQHHVSKKIRPRDVPSDSFKRPVQGVRTRNRRGQPQNEVRPQKEAGSSWQDNFNSETEKKSCYLCVQTFSSMSFLEQHLKSHLSGPYTCHLCFKQVHSGPNLHEHMRLHYIKANKKPFPCNLCCDSTSTFRTANELILHKLKFHKTKKYECEICVDKIFKSAEEFSEHKINVHCKKPFECYICPNSYVNKAGLNDHIMAKHTSQKVSCDICGKDFGTKALMSAHKQQQHLLMSRQSSKNGPAKCNICGFESKGIRNLRKHRKLHENLPKKYQCAYCSRMFRNKFGVDVHERTHTGVTPFRCEICEVSFKRKHHLSAHCNSINHKNREKTQQHLSSNETSKFCINVVGFGEEEEDVEPSILMPEINTGALQGEGIDLQSAILFSTSSDEYQFIIDKNYINE